MEIIEFAQHVADRLNEMFKLDYPVECKTVTKTNGTVYHGIGSFGSVSGIHPAIYIDGCYHNNMTVEDTAFYVYDKLKESEKDLPKVDLSWEVVKDCIYYKLVNREWNLSLLESVGLWDSFLDLAKVYYIRIPMMHGDVTGTVMINKQLIDTWKVSEEEVKCIATVNTNVEHTSEYMIPLLKGMMGDMGIDDEEIELFDMNPMVKARLFSRIDKVNGASVMCNNSFLKDILGETYHIILPSSIHEIITMPKVNDMDVDELKEMVTCINNSQVAPEERLSDNVYLWNGKEVTLL